jgi:hypothetical protein
MSGSRKRAGAAASAVPALFDAIALFHAPGSPVKALRYRLFHCQPRRCRIAVPDGLGNAAMHTHRVGQRQFVADGRAEMVKAAVRASSTRALIEAMNGLAGGFGDGAVELEIGSGRTRLGVSACLAKTVGATDHAPRPAPAVRPLGRRARPIRVSMPMRTSARGCAGSSTSGPVSKCQARHIGVEQVPAPARQHARADSRAGLDHALGGERLERLAQHGAGDREPVRADSVSEWQDRAFRHIGRRRWLQPICQSTCECRLRAIGYAPGDATAMRSPECRFPVLRICRVATVFPHALSAADLST